MRQSNSYTFIFISIVALIAALILSIASQALKERQQINVEVDMKRNILAAVGLLDRGVCTAGGEGCDISCCYSKNIKSYVVNSLGEQVKEETLVPESIIIENEIDKPEKERKYPLFVRKNKDGVSAYCIPIIGKGLWSTLYGYLALEKDLVTVKGVTFYKHGETPGLGAEIDKEWFLNNFKGKKIRDQSGKLVPVRVVKGKVNPSSRTAIHEVDGISGATLTCKGVNELIKESLKRYEPYFNSVRRNR